MARETYFPHLAILVPYRQSCACLRGQYALRKITRHSNHVPAAEQRPRHRRCPTSRDFVPWRFSDAGRPSVRRARHLPALENLHRSRLIRSLGQYGTLDRRAAPIGGPLLSTSRGDGWPADGRLYPCPLLSQHYEKATLVRVTAPQTTRTMPVTRLIRPPQGSVFSTSTRSARAAIHNTFINPPTNSRAISIQQQPRQKNPCRIPIT